MGVFEVKKNNCIFFMRKKTIWDPLKTQKKKRKSHILATISSICCHCLSKCAGSVIVSRAKWTKTKHFREPFWTEAHAVSGEQLGALLELRVTIASTSIHWDSATTGCSFWTHEKSEVYGFFLNAFGVYNKHILFLYYAWPKNKSCFKYKKKCIYRLIKLN